MLKIYTLGRFVSLVGQWLVCFNKELKVLCRVIIFEVLIIIKRKIRAKPDLERGDKSLICRLVEIR